MRALADLLAALPEARLIGAADRRVRKIEYWPGAVGPDDLFVAIAGDAAGTQARIAAGTAAGARTIVCAAPPADPRPDLSYVVVPDPAHAMGLLAHAFHGFPARQLAVVGVTGTNGKTSTVALLHGLFRALGHRAGLLSNIGDAIDDAWSAPRYTTGHALFLSEMMARMVAAGCTHCFMEVSSQGIIEERVAGVRFAGGLFTNLTRDHLDYHGTMAAYAAAKRSWLDALPAAAFALANLDDPLGAGMLAATRARRLGYGTAQASDYRLRVLRASLAGLEVEIAGRRVRSRLLGAFNAYNLAACFGAAVALGEDPARVAAALATLPPVEGRMETIRGADGRLAIVDYAHTPDAVAQVLRHLDGAREPGARILTVIGCGGGGDVGRRPLLATTAAAGSDRLILTSDNPRDEDPRAIAADMAAGLDGAAEARTETILDRRAAIRAACAAARPGDIVLIAGKGHERHQEIAGVRHPFDDRLVAADALGLRGAPDA